METTKFSVPMMASEEMILGPTGDELDGFASIHELMARPRCSLPADHPARLPAGRVRRWQALASMRLRARERALALRVHDWVARRYVDVCED